jgi:hypothetical protein
MLVEFLPSFFYLDFKSFVIAFIPAHQYGKKANQQIKTCLKSFILTSAFRDENYLRQLNFGSFRTCPCPRAVQQGSSSVPLYMLNY